MEQPFLGVETSMEHQLNPSPHHAHATSNNQPRVTPGDTSGKSADFDLSNPSNPSIASAQALLHNDGRYQQQQPYGQQYPQLHPQQPMNMPGSYQLHHLPTGQPQLQVPMNGQQYAAQLQQLPPPQLPHSHHLPQQLSQRGFPEQRYDGDGGSDGNSPPAQYTEKGLVAPIPPLHIQQQLVNGNGEAVTPVIKQDPSPSVEKPPLEPGAEVPPDQMFRSSCSRCKKEFDQPIIIPQSNQDGGATKFLAEPKIFKLCQHCRDLQRQRSRRWQKKTKDKLGACRRCGSDIPPEEQRYVLCPSCRSNLRKRKANRAAQGRCVHCSGPLSASIITDEKKRSASPPGSAGGSSDSGKASKDRQKAGNYKVCERCRENDKIRRTNLEKLGNCNRCAKALDAKDIGKHKVCASCRTRKKKLSQNINTTSNNGSLSRLQSISSASSQGGAAPGSAALPMSSLASQDQSHGIIAALPPAANVIAQPPMGMIPSDMAMLSNGNASVPYASVPMAQHYTTAQYVQAQAQAQAQVQYNQAVVQQQAFNQAMAQAQQQQQQQQAVAAHNARQLQQQQLQQQQYAGMGQQKPEDFSSYAVNQHQS